MAEREETAFKFLVSHEQLAEAIKPAMRDFDDPPSCPLLGIAPIDVCFLAAANDERDIAVRLDRVKVLRAAAPFIATKVLDASKQRALALKNDDLEGLVASLAVIDVGSGHYERIRDATDVHQQVAFASFIPRSVGFGPTASCAKRAFIMAPSTLWPLLNFEWVMRDLGCRSFGVEGGRSPAQRTLEAKRPALRWSMAGCSAVGHPAMETSAAPWVRAVG